MKDFRIDLFRDNKHFKLYFDTLADCQIWRSLHMNGIAFLLQRNFGTDNKYDVVKEI